MNLLVDNVFRVETAAGLQRMSLPALLEALGREQVNSYPGIQRHQEDAFHVFLCYLAGAVLARDYDWQIERDQEFWRDGLRRLSGRSDDSAWTLVVADLSLPAFMQPPLPPAEHSKLQLKATTPDELDLLPTAKNHDLKIARAGKPEWDEWIFALISLQTMSGFFGQGNQGISRMNGGFGNRPVVEFRHSFRPSMLWRDALVRLQEHRKEVLIGPWGFASDGLVLVWLPVWDGQATISVQSLDPFYIEICRRLRLRADGRDRCLVFGLPAKVPRLATKDLKGNLGDAWLPIDLSKDSALTFGPAGVTPVLLRRIIFEDEMKLTQLQRPLHETSEEAWLSVSVLVRGQGTTDGFHHHSVPIPAKARKRLFATDKSDRDRLAVLSKTAIEYAGTMQNRVLKPALFAYLQGGPANVQLDRESATAWWQRALRRYQALWADSYFPWLWRALDTQDPDAACHGWASFLRDKALQVFEQSLQAMPSHAGRRYRSQTQAEHFFWAALYSSKNFPFLKEVKHDSSLS